MNFTKQQIIDICNQVKIANEYDKKIRDALEIIMSDWYASFFVASDAVMEAIKIVMTESQYDDFSWFVFEADFWKHFKSIEVDWKKVDVSTIDKYADYFVSQKWL